MDNFINRRICGNGFVPGLVGINSFLEPVLDESGSLDEALHLGTVGISKSIEQPTEVSMMVAIKRREDEFRPFHIRGRKSSVLPHEKKPEPVVLEQRDY